MILAIAQIRFDQGLGGKFLILGTTVA